jgi:hypothetical protein
LLDDVAQVVATQHRTEQVRQYGKTYFNRCLVLDAREHVVYIFNDVPDVTEASPVGSPATTSPVTSRFLVIGCSGVPERTI